MRGPAVRRRIVPISREARARDAKEAGRLADAWESVV